MPENDRRPPRSSPALSSRSRQPLGDDRLRHGVDQVVEQGAVARDRDTVEPPLDEEVIQPFGVANTGPIDDPDVVVEGDAEGLYYLFTERRLDSVSISGDRALLERLIDAAPQPMVV